MKDFIIPDRDFGTPAAKSKTMVTLTIDGFDITVPEGTSIMRAAAEIGIRVPKLCATDSIDAFGSCRLCLVEIEGRQRHAGLLHHTRCRRHGRAHPDRQAETATQGRDGALHLRPSARLPDLLGQWRLRIAGHGGRGRPARRALRTRRQPFQAARRSGGSVNALYMPKDESNPYFTYDPASASCAAAAYGRARRCRAPSR
jgi:formate dehydrogenase major subunit